MSTEMREAESREVESREVELREAESREAESREAESREAESREGESRAANEAARESGERRAPGWKKAAIWVIGAGALAVVGYRGALGGREGVAARPSMSIRADVGESDAGAAGPGATAGVPGAETAGRPGSIGPAHGAVGGTVAVAKEGGADSHVDAGPGGEGSGVAAPGGAVSGGAASAAASDGPPERGVARGGGAAGAAAGGDPQAAGQAITADGRIILNLASEAELRKLPGIGKSKARAIVERREKLGRFRRLEDLLRVKGIGPRRLAALRAKLVLDPPR